MAQIIKQTALLSPYDEKYFDGLNRHGVWGNNRYRECQRIHTLETFCRPQKDDDMLELGCGTGHYTRLLAPRVRRIVGVDFSEAAIHKARSADREENTQYILADIQNLGQFAPESFRKIIAVDVLEHLTDGQLANVLSEVNRLLTVKGLFVLFTPCRTHWIERVKSRGFLIKQTAGHIGVRSEQEIQDFIRRAGLHVRGVARYETCIPVLRLLEKRLKQIPAMGALFVSRLGMSASKTGGTDGMNGSR